MKAKDFVRQRDAMQCGVAALTMVCRHFGANYSLDFVSRFCHPTNEGVSLKGISDAAEHLGLDTRNEREIVENLAEFYRGRTVVVVAHRLSTVRNADNIIVLDHGRVIEQGTHEELTALRGAYFNLVRNQLELGG